MSEYKPKVGDRVKVVLEGEVIRVSEAYGGYFQVGRDHEVWLTDNDALVSIEKVEPPVVRFGPGDLVRHKAHSEAMFAIGADGYFGFRTQRYYTDDRDPFTSEHYEKVEL